MERLRIALVNPPRTRFAHDPVRAGTPLGLLSLGAMVKKHMPACEVSLVDALAEGKGDVEIGPGVLRHGLTHGQLRARLADLRPDVVGISNIFTCEWQGAAWCAAVAREANPDVKIVMGGHHASAEPEFMLTKGGADYVVMWEGEYPFLELMGALGRGCDGTGLAAVQGIAFRQDGSIVKTGRGRIATALDGLEDPDFGLLRPEIYGPETSHSGAVPEGYRSLADLSVTRGCPYACTYCTSSSAWGRKVRSFSPSRARGQVRRLRELGFDHICVEDDQVLFIPKPTRDALFCELRAQGFAWCMDSGLYYPRITREFVRAAAENGCYQIAVTIEHPDLAMMHGEHKFGDVGSQSEAKGKITETMSLLREHGIRFYVVLMAGFANETEESLGRVEEYARFVKEQGAAWVVFFYPKPLPGTVDYLRSYGQVPEEWRWENSPEKWTLPSPVLVPKNIPLEVMVGRINELCMELNGHPNTLIDPKWGK